MPRKRIDPTALSASGGRTRAIREVTLWPICAECEVAPATNRHHWDGDPRNNERNVVALCVPCHRRLHRQDRCARGHPLSGDNLGVSGSIRYCRACKREQARHWDARHPERRARQR